MAGQPVSRRGICWRVPPVCCRRAATSPATSTATRAPRHPPTRRGSGSSSPNQTSSSPRLASTIATQVVLRREVAWAAHRVPPMAAAPRPATIWAPGGVGDPASELSARLGSVAATAWTVVGVLRGARGGRPTWKESSSGNSMVRGPFLWPRPTGSDPNRCSRRPWSRTRTS